MTYVQTQKQDIYFRIIFITLAALLFTGVAWLVMLYNKNVNLTHEISTLKADTQNLQTQNAEVKDRYFAQVSADNLERLAAEHFLVKDNNPKYFRLGKATPWQFASHF